MDTFWGTGYAVACDLLRAGHCLTGPAEGGVLAADHKAACSYNGSPIVNGKGRLQTCHRSNKLPMGPDHDYTCVHGQRTAGVAFAEAA